MSPSWQNRVLGLALLAICVLTGIMAFVGDDPAGPRASVIRGGDFVAFWTGGIVLAEGDSDLLYRRARTAAVLKEMFPQDPPRYPLSYPPPLYQICAAMQGFTWPVAVRVLILLMTVLAVTGTGLLVSSMDGLSGRRPLVWAGCITGPPVVWMQLTGQFAGLWLLMLGGAVWLRNHGRGFAGGCVLGLLAAKPTLAFAAGLALLALREWRMLLGMAVGSTVLVGVSWALDPRAWSAYVDALADGAANDIWIRWGRQYTLRTLLGSLVDRPAAKVVGWVGVGIGIVGTGVIAWLAGRKTHWPDPWLVTGTVLSMSLLATPHLLDYDLGFHYLGQAAAVSWILSGRARWPRLGWIVTFLAWITTVTQPLNAWAGWSVATLPLLVWVGWATAEIVRGRAQGTGSSSVSSEGTTP